jgi:hypothetical protein
VWRLIRAKGSIVYFALDVLNASPHGVLFEEKEMRFGLGRIGTFTAASLGVAC